MKEIFTRRSVRKFTEQKVDEEKITQVLKAAMQAPSAGNQQPWEFIVIDDKQMLEELSKVSPYAVMTASAPVAIVVVANMDHLKYPDYWQIDLSAATENLLLEATHLGFGGVWLGIAPDEERMNYVSKVLNLPESVKAFTVLPIGYSAVELKPMDRFNPDKIHHNKY